MTWRPWREAPPPVPRPCRYLHVRSRSATKCAVAAAPTHSSPPRTTPAVRRHPNPRRSYFQGTASSGSPCAATSGEHLPLPPARSRHCWGRRLAWMWPRPWLASAAAWPRHPCPSWASTSAGPEPHPAKQRMRLLGRNFPPHARSREAYTHQPVPNRRSRCRRTLTHSIPPDKPPLLSHTQHGLRQPPVTTRPWSMKVLHVLCR